jgi:hypothetical protein
MLDKNLLGDKIIPIIEPVKVTSTLASTLKKYSQQNHSIILIMNPAVGEFVKTIKEENKKSYLAKELNIEQILHGYIMDNSTPALLKEMPNVEDFVIINPSRDSLDPFLKIYENVEPRYSLIPYDRVFSRKTPNSKVLFEDKFNKTSRNIDYLLNEDEFFSDDHLFYNIEGYKGFSDYSVVGSEYNESGFAPLAVAIHIVYFDKNNNLRIHHFVSDTNDDINDPAGKFGEALGKLINWIHNNNVYLTEGLKLFEECYKHGKYPGLGTVKKYSIMHHLELMNRFLEGKKIK